MARDAELCERGRASRKSLLGSPRRPPGRPRRSLCAAPGRAYMKAPCRPLGRARFAPFRPRLRPWPRLYHGRRANRGEDGAAIRGANPPLFRPGGEEGAAGGGQRLRLARRDDGAQSAVRRSDLPAVLRPAGTAIARRAIARLGRDRRRQRPRRHQSSRHRGHDRREGRAVRPPRIRSQDRAARSAHRFGGAANPERRALSRARARGFRRDRGRRLRAGDRQSLRRRPDRDAGHRFGAGAHPDRRQRLWLFHPDGRRDQPRQFRRRAGRSRRTPRRHQFGDRFALGRQRGARLRHPRQHGQKRRRRGQERRRHGQAAVARRQPAERLQGHRRIRSAWSGRSGRWWSTRSKAVRRRRRA